MPIFGITNVKKNLNTPIVASGGTSSTVTVGGTQYRYRTFIGNTTGTFTITDLPRINGVVQTIQVFLLGGGGDATSRGGGGGGYTATHTFTPTTGSFSMRFNVGGTSNTEAFGYSVTSGDFSTSADGGFGGSGGGAGTTGGGCGSFNAGNGGSNGGNGANSSTSSGGGGQGSTTRAFGETAGALYGGGGGGGTCSDLRTPGTGGAGGGGNGAATGSGQDGVNGSGGGAGGGGAVIGSANGGTGRIVIRYPVSYETIA